MNTALESLIQAASKPLDPHPTQVDPQLPKLPGIRGVLFDIYGTLIISGSGDIGAADPTVRGQAFVEALAAIGLTYNGDPHAGAIALRATIEQSHTQSRDAGVEYPEVDIVRIWRQTCEQLASAGQLKSREGSSLAEVDYEQLAVEFEIRTNPVWPMPALSETLAKLQERGQVLGIISNAQFFTPLIFPAIAAGTLDQYGFHPKLRYYSYMSGHAKPGLWLYQQAAAGLASLPQPISPEEVLYVGNDMRNDIWPAAKVGFNTVLFAGDQRSLRLRDDQPNRKNLPQPDAIVTQLDQISTIID